MVTLQISRVSSASVVGYSLEDSVPPPCMLHFPAFPRSPPGSRLHAISSHDSKGIDFESVTTVYRQPHPSIRGQSLPLVSVPPAVQTDISKQLSPPACRVVNKDGLVCIPIDSAWSIGNLNIDWKEPSNTSISDYDLNIPPFTRLLAATRDFLNSRRPAFQYKRSKLLLDLMRNAFGLRTGYDEPHWSHDRSVEGRDPKAEACVLLTHPVTSVRGFLAMARREAEAGWEFEPALQLSYITAAFLSFVEHYQVLIDIPEFATAAALARRSPTQLLDAKAMEDILSDSRKWNRASWTVWGGEYAGAERGGWEYEGSQWPQQEDSVNRVEDDGGWKVETSIDIRPVAASIAQVTPYLDLLISPADTRCCLLVEYLPFARRVITAVLPPPSSEHSLGCIETTLWRLVTEPAPWSADERWRTPRPRFRDEYEDEELSHTLEVNEFEREAATAPEPMQLTLHVELDEEMQTDVERLVGMGLRGRWGYVEDARTAKGWWILKLKDFVLPAFWQKEGRPQVD